jgi:hypothetical protein
MSERVAAPATFNRLRIDVAATRHMNPYFVSWRPIKPINHGKPKDMQQFSKVKAGLIGARISE